MKFHQYVKGLAGLFVLALIAGGCQEEDEPPQFEELSFNKQEVLDKLPDGLKNSNDQYAQSCLSYIESALDMSSFMGNLVPPGDAQKNMKKSTMNGDTWTWTWSFEGESFTFYWTYDEDSNKRYWSMDIQYGGGPRYDYIDAWEMKDGSQGEVIYNYNWVCLYSGESQEECTDLFWRYTWSTDESGTCHFDWYYDAADPACDYFLHSGIQVNPDGSGSIDYYSMDMLLYHMEWDAQGNGSWEYYLDGSVVMSGTWTAG